MRLTLLLVLLLLTSAAFAQTEYMTHGGTVLGGSGARVVSDDQLGFGAGMEVLATPRVGFRFAYTNSERRGSGDPREVSAWSVGVQTYPGRQGMDGTATVGLGVSVGRFIDADATTLSIDAVVARALSNNDGELGLRFVPKVQAGLAIALAGEEGGAAVQTLAFGLGLGVAFAPGTVVFLEPSLAFTVSQEGRQMFGGGTLGVALAL